MHKTKLQQRTQTSKTTQRRALLLNFTPRPTHSLASEHVDNFLHCSFFSLCNCTPFSNYSCSALQLASFPFLPLCVSSIPILSNPFWDIFCYLCIPLLHSASFAFPLHLSFSILVIIQNPIHHPTRITKTNNPIPNQLPKKPVPSPFSFFPFHSFPFFAPACMVGMSLLSTSCTKSPFPYLPFFPFFFHSLRWPAWQRWESSVTAA